MSDRFSEMERGGDSSGKEGGSSGKQVVTGKIIGDDKCFASVMNSGPKDVDGGQKNNHAGESGNNFGAGGKKRRISGDENANNESEPNKLKEKRNDEIQLISSELQGRFRRATWVLGRINNPSVVSLESTMVELDDDCDVTMREEDEEPAGRVLQRISEVDVADALAILGNRDFNVVAVMGTSLSALLIEQPTNTPPAADDSEKCTEKKAAADTSSKVVITRNPKSDIDMKKEKDPSWQGFWQGSAGIKVQNVRTATLQTQPDGRPSFTNHIGFIIRYIEAICNATTETESETLVQGLVIYIFRTCLVKMATRMQYHCNALKQSKGGNAQDKNKSTLPKDLPTYDYVCYLLPSKNFKELATFSGCEGILEEQMDILKSVFATRNRGSYSGKYENEILPTGREQRVLDWLGKTFPSSGMDWKKARPATVQEAVGTLIVMFLSGCSAVFRILEAKNDLGNRVKGWLRDDPGTWNSSFRSGMIRTAISGRKLKSLLTPNGLVEHHIRHIFEDERVQVGCMKWLRRITSHFYAISLLTQPSVRSRLVITDFSVLETQLYEHDQSMEDLPSFIDRADLMYGFLSDDDKKRLVAHLRPKANFQGTTHCEATLLLLCIVARDDHYWKLLPDDLVAVFRKVDPKFLGVSNGSCPICSEVVKLAQERFGFPIAHSGSHGIFSACALSHWTPAPIAELLTARIEAKCHIALRRCAGNLASKLGYSKGTSQTPEAPSIEERTEAQIDKEDSLWDTSTEWDPAWSLPEPTGTKWVGDANSAEKMPDDKRIEE